MNIFRNWLNSIYGVLMVMALFILGAFEWLKLLGELGATVYSDELVKNRLGRRVAPNVSRAGVDAILWHFAALPVGNIADVLVCGKILKGDRVIGGREIHSALTSGAGTATGSYGTYAVDSDGMSLGAVNDADRFLVATSFEAAGSTVLADTIAHFNDWEADADYFVVCVNSVEAFATSGLIQGHLLVARG